MSNATYVASKHFKMAAPLAKFGHTSFSHFSRVINVNRQCMTRSLYVSMQNNADSKKGSREAAQTSINEDSNSSLSSSFQDMMHNRHSQASKSLLVRLANGTSLENLLQYCNSQGKVEHYFTYFQKAHYVVVEFSNAETIKQITGKAYAPGSNQKKTQNAQDFIETRFLSFSKPVKRKEKGLPAKKHDVVILNKDLSNAELLHSLAIAPNVDAQLELLVQEQEVREEETRLRFLACSLIQEAFQGILPDASLHPFGSSVNGFGRRSCDVDMYLDRGTAQGVIPQKQGRNRYKLGYDRQSAHSERVATQSTLFTLAEFLERHVPQCSFVNRILNARCPLVKFQHQATGLSCDLTGDNRIAIKSSEMLYVFGHMDPRVRPLVFMVRHWARLNGITNNNPGYWITNYPLTLLVIFFLQSRPEPVLPALNKIALFEPAAEGMDEEEKDVDLIFTDAARVSTSRNTETLTELLQEFFVFCTSCDFNRHALSVHSGSMYSKPRTDKAFPLYIENPLEPELNSSKNVSANLLDRMSKLSQDALRTMETLEFHQPQEGADRVHAWGLGALLMGSVQGGKGRKRSVAMERKLGSVFRSLGRRDFSTAPQRLVSCEGACRADQNCRDVVSAVNRSELRDRSHDALWDSGHPSKCSLRNIDCLQESKRDR